MAELPETLRRTEGAMTMLDHISIGVRDIERAKRFYDAALAPLGYRCLHESKGTLGYGGHHAALWVMAAASPVRADDKSGLHVCLAAPTRQGVDQFHAQALANGGEIGPVDNVAYGEWMIVGQ